jgi:HK97 family phage prohead protease
MTMTLDANKNMYQYVSDDSEIIALEKASKRPLGVTDISEALDEYKKLFTAGISSPSELLTLVRAFPTNKTYTNAAKKLGMFEDDFEPMVVGGPASVEMVDREGHLITTDALQRAFVNYMKSFRTRNAMVLHSDVQVGWALPAYISKSGNVYKSGVDPKGLFFICELRDDTRIAKRVMEQIKEGKLKSYSIAGSATKTQNIQKGMQSYMQVDDMELAEVTVCEKGVNQDASFSILKSSSGRPTKSCIDGSCLMKSEHTHNPTTVLVKQDGNIDFLASLLNLVKDDNPFTNTIGTDDTELLETEAYRKREQLHHSLLDEQGFPAEVEPEQMRYIPVVEDDFDEDGKVINKKPPWIVNTAGQDLGTSHTNEALTPPKGDSIGKPTNLQKFLSLSPQRNKSMIVEGYDSATEAFFAKTESDMKLEKFPLARVAVAAPSSHIGYVQSLPSEQKAKKDTEGKKLNKFLPLLSLLMGSSRANRDKIKKSQDNVQYAMFDDQRESSRPTQPRRRQVTTGDSSIPFLIELVRGNASKPSTLVKKSDDCGCS